MRFVITVGMALALVAGGLGSADATEIMSLDFGSGEEIPAEFTCHGPDVNPRLQISGIPPEAKSLLLLVYDVDAPSGSWVHWVVYNMPVINHIRRDSVPGTQGINDFGRVQYDGPCPPSGRHQYYFSVYVLDVMLDLPPGLTSQQVIDAVDGRVIDEAMVMGVFGKEAAGDRDEKKTDPDR